MGGWFSPSRVLFPTGCAWEFLPDAAQRGMDAMQINGLLVTLAPQSRAKCEAIARHLAGRTELSVGELNDRWLPVAMEAVDDAHAREIHDWIGAQPGVEFVDVVSVSFDDADVSPMDSEQAQMKNSIRGHSESAGRKAAVQFSALND